MSSIYLFCLKKATVFILEIFFNFDPNTGSFKTRKNEFNSTLGLINVTLVNGFPSNPFTSRLLYLICFVLIKDNRLETKAKENCSDLFSSRAVYCCWGNLLICFSFHNYNAARRTSPWWGKVIWLLPIKMLMKNNSLLTFPIQAFLH